MLAEDNRVNQAVASRLLAKLGHTPVIANNGREALDLLEQDTFDVVLMDVQMPEMDGILATKSIRALEKSTHRHRHIPIIAMTAHAMKGDRARCIAAGMDGYVTKPINLEEVTAAILAALHITPERDTSLDHRSREILEIGEVSWDMSKTLEQLGGDETLLQEVMDIFLEQAPKHLEALRLAVAQGQAERVETTAHTLKGELGYLGIPAISQRASEIEETGRSKDVSRAASLLPRFEADITGLFRAIRSAKACPEPRVTIESLICEDSAKANRGPSCSLVGPTRCVCVTAASWEFDRSWCTRPTGSLWMSGGG